MSTQAGKSTVVLNQKPSAEEQGQQSLSVKNQIVCSLGFMGHIAVTTQSGHFRVKVAIAILEQMSVVVFQ